ncbi:hypothetical protein WEN_02270 [Mycoplasma wenyonii str. Massachusetts]|uniref:Uncharacterized protein n=1 Tax=Mycoplasma wenyonii (strain Massachusetts) TaxID=1197325 RepID=I6YBA5_MYCWM|nr:hypothetical protein [Mycoplasma wenyonii]AFN65241.1 hypothetical protein WEN_02270 [Mycoplasma wenyonii str. Massachusetts]
MIIQSLVAKVAIATLVTGIVGSSIAVPVVLTSGTTGTQVETKQSGPDLGECFVIPTETDDQQKQLLMCKEKGAERTGLDKKNYWYREGSGTGAKKTKVTKIIKRGEGLEITLEGDVSLVQIIPLKAKLENWSSIPKQADLNSICELTEDAEVKWQCFTEEGMAGITLTKFLEQ